MRTSRLKRIGRLACLMLMLTSVLLAFSLLPSGEAAMAVLKVDPASGYVGTSVFVTANISTLNGNYEMYFDDQLVANATALQYQAATSFIVPLAAAGNHTVLVKDTTTGENATGTFTVTTSYSVSVPAVVKPFQEGDVVPILVNVTGGDSGASYGMNVTVQAPTSKSYSGALSVAVSSLGNGTGTLNYPNDFSAGANTSFVGNYAVSLNTTVASSSFFVGLTNSTEYHRNQTVNIKAAYAADENVTVTIKGTGVQESANVSDPSGLISFDWTVPSNASIGSYNVTVLSVSGPTVKKPSDTQNFTIPGLAINITAKNLAGGTVQSVNVTALENATAAGNNVTDSAGLTLLNLEIGSYTLDAYFKDALVGERELEVNDTMSLDLPCNLTDIGIRVVSLVGGNEISVPEVGIFLTPDNTTFSTDINGAVVIESLLPNLTYSLNLTRFSTPFNFTTIPQLLVDQTPVAWYNVTFTIPNLTLTVNVTRSDGNPIEGALVKAQDTSGAPLLEGRTDVSGTVVIDAPLGKYDVKVYDDNGILLNETAADLLQNQSVSIRCDLFGLDVSVTVVDYFGQGIANVNVELQRTGSSVNPLLARTGGDGRVVFNNITGGGFEMTLYLSDPSQPLGAQGLAIGGSETIQVKIGKYVVLAGALVETSLFATITVIIVAIVLALVVEIYIMRRRKAKKSEVASSNKES